MKTIISTVTEYGKRIQFELLARNKTRNWLIEQLRQRTGKYVDGSNLYKLMTGKIKSSWMTNAIQEILGIEYEGD